MSGKTIVLFGIGVSLRKDNKIGGMAGTLVLYNEGLFKFA